jgi:hypothetical protein
LKERIVVGNTRITQQVMPHGVTPEEAGPLKNGFRR